MKIDPERLERMKRLHLPTIMMEYGVVLKTAGRESLLGVCPFHEDKNPSLSVGKRGDKWVWNCFGCRAHGNVIDFLTKKEDKSFGDVYRILDVKLNGSVPIETLSPPATTTPVKSPAASSVRPSELLTRVVEIYHGAFCETKSAQDYLAGRGIKGGELIRHFRIGFADGRLRRMLPADPSHEFVAGLKAVGVLNEKGGEFFHGCVTFPILDENGATVGLYGRRAVGTGPAHLYLPGPRRGVWNGAAFKAHREIILTESIIDALSLCTLGFTNAVPLYGVNGMTEDHLRLMKEHRTAKAFVCLDNDDTGRAARPRVQAALSPLGVEVVDVFLLDGVKDINEALQKGLTADGFKVRMPTASGAAAVAVPAPVLPSTREEGPTVEQSEGMIHLDFGARKYRIRGLTAKNLDALRVNIKVETSGGYHLDTFDLYSAKSRATFIACCRKIFEASEGELNKELNRIIGELERIQGGMLDGKTEGEAEPPTMSQEEGAEAFAALQRPTLLDDILRDMETIGYVGEEANKAIGYLVGVSRKLDDPLSCVIISQSGAGKSVLAETVEKMTPTEDVLLFSRMTQFALFYYKDKLKGKLLILEERIGAEEADYSIRTLQSKKKLVQAVPIKDPATGKIVTQTMTVEGPIAYIETTTRPRIHDENATRCFELYLDESEEQTKRIHQRQKESKTLCGLKKKEEQDRLIRRHHNMQRLLAPVRVVTPYAHLIEFPARWLRTRRDHLRFLNLIEVIAFIHQHQRQRKAADDAEYIEATVEDYAKAFSLARQVLGESFTELKKPQRELLFAVEKLIEEKKDDVTRRQIREHTGLTDYRLRDLLSELVSLEYLAEIGGGQGKMCRYRLADRGIRPEKIVVGLTTPEELAAKLRVSG